MLTLKVEKRDTKKKPEMVRKDGMTPAVFYGRKEKSMPISVNTREFEKIFREAGESTIISLEGVGEAKEALIHDVDVHPVTGNVRHADFYVIEKGKKLHVDVPLVFEGESPAVKDLGGILVKVIHELEIEALPRDLPHEIVVDISTLVDFESQITVQDLTLADGVTSLVESEEVVVTVSKPKEEEEEEEAAEVDMDAIEVEGEKDKAEGGDQGEGDSKQAKDSQAKSGS